MFQGIRNTSRKTKSMGWYVFDYYTTVMIPVVIIACIMGYNYISMEKTKLLDSAVRWSIDASAGLDAEISADIAVLNTMASSPDIKSGNLTEFYKRIKPLLLPGGSWISVRDRNGTVLMSTGLEHSGPTGATYHEARIDHAIFDLGQDYMSGVRMGTTRKEWIVIVATPVFDKDDHIIYCLQYVIPAFHMLKLLNDTTIPPGWFMTLVDDNYNIIARTSNHDQYVGHPANPQFFDIIHDIPPGGSASWDNKTSFEGNRIIGAIHKMTASGWTVGVAAESSVYGQPLWYALSVGGGFAVIFISTIIFVHGLFVGKLRHAFILIQRKVADLKDNRIEAYPPTKIREFDDAMQAIDDAGNLQMANRVQLKATQKELHHRVKNSLQMVASLLRLQRSSSNDDITKDALDTAALRIGCIGRVHQGLYDTDDLIINTSYLHNIIHDIQEKIPVTIKAEIESTVLDLDFGNPLALILEEAVTNGYRHGSKQGEKTQIDISFTVVDHKFWTLVVRDHGPGFSTPPSRRGATLGMKLMTALERQLCAHVTFTNHPDGGGVVTVVGPLKMDRVVDRMRA